jgi:hypothetical protein
LSVELSFHGIPLSVLHGKDSSFPFLKIYSLKKVKIENFSISTTSIICAKATKVPPSQLGERMYNIFLGGKIGHTKMCI